MENWNCLKAECCADQGYSLIQSRHCPDHKLIEQRHGERHIAVRRAVNHPFLDELGPHRAESGNSHAERFGDVRRTMRPAAETRHTAQKPLLAWRKPVETNAEKVLIQALDYRRGGL